MIFHLATRRGIKAFTKHLNYRPAFNRRVRAIAYESILDQKEWQRGVYVFTDFERMTTPQKAFASSLHAKLSDRRDAFRVMNHPVRHIDRFDLLRQLFEEGLNEFNVYRAHELSNSARFPVFLRYEDRHIGASTPLLHTLAEAEDALARMAALGDDIDHIIAVEFADTVDSAGLFRKYGAFRVGKTIVPRHMFASKSWEVKIDTNTKSAFRRSEEYGYLRGNPHESQVMEVFDRVGLEYGRIDYAMKDGKIQVWEVNDNPQMTSSLVRYWRGRLGRCLLSLRNLDYAFSEVEKEYEPGPPVKFDSERMPVWEALCSR